MLGTDLDYGFVVIASSYLFVLGVGIAWLIQRIRRRKGGR